MLHFPLKQISVQQLTLGGLIMLNGITILQRARKELAKVVEEGNQEILSFGLSEQDATMLGAYEGALESLDKILDILEELEYELEYGGV